MPRQYLTGIPTKAKDWGFSKTLLVRKESIHLKHIMTEVFVRKSVDIDKYLNEIGWTLDRYLAYLTNRMRRVYDIPRDIQNYPSTVHKTSMKRFFPAIDIVEGTKSGIVLDFDGVCTDKSFKFLYDICWGSLSPLHICTANPTVNREWFYKHEMYMPDHIHNMKGKIKKIKRLIYLQEQYDFLFYVDNEVRYLEFAWLWGLKTYHWDGRKIKHFSLNTK